MNRMSRVAVGAAALAFALSACGAPGGGSDTNNDSGADATANGPVSGTVKLGGTKEPYMDAVVAAFKKANPQVQVEFSAEGVNFENGAIQALLRSGSGPDALLVNSGPGRVGLLSDAGLLRPLDAVYERSKLDQVYPTSLLDQIRAQGKGKIYEVVEGMGVYQVYYNKAMFAEVGITPPETWDQFLSNCQRLKAAGRKPIVAGLRDNFAGGWLFGELLQSSAGTKTMQDVFYGGGRFDQPALVRGAEMLEQLVKDGCVNGKDAAALDSNQSRAAFANDQGAMIFVGQELPGEAEKAGADPAKFGSFVLPSRDSGQPATPTAGLGYSWVISAQAKNVPAAERWIEFAASEEYLKLTTENGLVQVPARKVPPGVTLKPALQDAAGKLANGAGYNPSVYLDASGKDAYYAAIQALVTGQMSAQQAMASIEAARKK
jgi:raffinose/stachyose/melibiose transport system substrate-binding protein